MKIGTTRMENKPIPSEIVNDFTISLLAQPKCVLSYFEKTLMLTDI